MLHAFYGFTSMGHILMAVRTAFFRHDGIYRSDVVQNQNQKPAATSRWSARRFQEGRGTRRRSSVTSYLSPLCWAVDGEHAGMTRISTPGGCYKNRGRPRYAFSQA